MTVWTIGHGTRRVDELIELLTSQGIGRLTDVRTIPRSRHNPQFNRDRLPDDLVRAGISYVHMPGLGGLRRPRSDSVNLAWRNSGVRGYADYMQTAAFQANLDVLVRQAAGARTAIMCAETVPWRCHRSLLADTLTVNGVAVHHIITAGQTQPHELTAGARPCNGLLTYPGEIDRGHSP
jgi:uncharacterized protein (DUF488 family)